MYVKSSICHCFSNAHYITQSALSDADIKVESGVNLTPLPSWEWLGTNTGRAGVQLIAYLMRSRWLLYNGTGLGESQMANNILDRHQEGKEYMASPQHDQFWLKFSLVLLIFITTIMRYHSRRNSRSWWHSAFLYYDINVNFFIFSTFLFPRLRTI